MQKRILILMLCCLLLLPGLVAATEANQTVDTILAAQAVKSYTDEAVTAEDIDIILAAGAKAPSARNSQPWHFTVVQDAGIIGQLARDGNGVMIVISGLEAEGEGMSVDFDCGLATQNMYLAAHSLGLGANIATGSVRNAEAMRDALGIPEGYRVVALLSVGHVDADAVSEATGRNAVEDMTNYVQ